MALTSIAFLLAFTGALCLSLVRHPAWGLYTYIAIFYLHPPDRWWGEMLPDLRWSLLAAFVTLLSLWRLDPAPDRPSWLQNHVVRAFLLFVTWLWIQFPWALDKELQLEVGVLFTKYALLIYLFYTIVRSEETLRNVLIAHVLGCFYLAWIVFVTPDSGRPDGRFDGVGGPGIDDANALAAQLSTGLLAAAILILNASMRVRIVAAVAAPFIVNGIVQTLSRGPVLGLLAGGLVMLLITPARYRKMFYGLGVIGVFVLLQMAPAKFWERLGTISAPVQETAEVDMSTETRLVLADAQLRMALDYPFGAGHRGTAVLSPRYLPEEYMAKDVSGAIALNSRSSHNTFLSVLVEQGVPGAILFVVLLVIGFRQVRAMNTLDTPGDMDALAGYRAAIAGCITCILVAGLFMDFLKAEISIWMLGLLAALGELYRRSAASPQPVARAEKPAVEPGVKPRPKQPQRPLKPAASPRGRR